MKVLISGASGLIGKALKEAFSNRGDFVQTLVRRESRDETEYTWDIEKGYVDLGAFEGVDVVIHLGGVNVASGYWTKARKQSLRDSRIKSTTLIAATISELENPPKVFLCASAVGIYGERGDDYVDEASQIGSGFLAELGRDWEGAASLVVNTRLVQLRFGIVLDPQGGALEKMLTPFRMGLGGKLGNGKQYISWITLSDAIAAVLFAIDTGELKGPVNIVSPHAVTNAGFASGLAAVLQRPAICHVPAFALKLTVGDMADEMLLISTRAVPKKLLENGFKFEDEDLKIALSEMLGKR